MGGSAGCVCSQRSGIGDGEVNEGQHSGVHSEEDYKAPSDSAHGADHRQSKGVCAPITKSATILCE